MECKFCNMKHYDVADEIVCWSERLQKAETSKQEFVCELLGWTREWIDSTLAPSDSFARGARYCATKLASFIHEKTGTACDPNCRCITATTRKNCEGEKP